MVRAPHAADWVLSRGQSALTNEQLAELLNVPTTQIRQRLHEPRKRGEWVLPTSGLWIPVPLEYRAWGAPPGIEIIDHMMSFLETDYYIGWLTAAALHGASHQAPQIFQVATSRRVADRTVGRTTFDFVVRRDAGREDVQSRVTRTGRVRVAELPLTMCNVATDIVMSGGMSNVATVLIELSESHEFSVTDLLDEARRHPAAVIRRIGWVLDAFGSLEQDVLEQLRDAAQGGPASPSRLNPLKSAAGTVDSSWNVYVNDNSIEADA